MSNEELIIQLRNDGDRQRILMELYQQNTGLIFQAIRPYIRKDNMKDLKQTAFIGLMEAVDRYDPDKALFATYLPYQIRAAVGRFYRKNSHDASLPEHVQQKIYQHNRLVWEYLVQHGEEPHDSYIRYRMRITQDQLDDLRNIIRQNQNHAISLDEKIPGSEEISYADLIPDKHDQYGDLLDRLSNDQDAAVIWSEVDQLDAKQAEAIRIRFQDNRTINEVGEMMEISGAKARALIDGGCNRLRNKKKIRKIARDHGYSTDELFGGGLSRFRNTGTSIVEWAVLRRLEPQQKKKQ